MDSQLSFIEWLTQALYLIESEDLSIHIRRRSEGVLEASLSSMLRIDETRQGVRRFVLLGVDGAQYAAVERFCLEYSSQTGVLEVFLVSRGTPDEQTSQILMRYEVRSVAISDDGGFTPPTPETTANFAQFLLGALQLDEAVTHLRNLEEAAQAPGSPDEAESLEYSAFFTLLTLYLSEPELLHRGGTTSRFAVQTSGKGTTSATTHGYAVQSYSLEDRHVDVLLPERSHLEEGLSRAAGVCVTMRQLERAGREEAPTKMLDRVARRFLSYYLSWLDGRCHELAYETLRDECAELADSPFISMLAQRLPEAPPPEQIMLIQLLRQVSARSATPLLLDALASMAPKAQEACLETLADFGTLDDVARLEPFLTSRRESLRDAALMVIGRSGGDGAAMYLAQLLRAQTVPITESALNAIAATRSAAAVRILVGFGAGRETLEPPVLQAVEAAIDAMGIDAVRSAMVDMPIEVLEGYVASLFAAEVPGARRLALKLITAFRLPTGIPYIEEALRDESVVTRLHAIRAVAELPEDRLVTALASSLAELPEDYETRRLWEWMQANLDVQFHRDGPAGWIGSVDDLDLRKAARASLSTAGTALAAACLEQLTTSTPAAADEGPVSAEEQLDWRSIPLLNSVFSCSGGRMLWVWHSTREREPDDVATATLIHGNQFEDSQGLGVAQSMLSGGLSSTMGTEAEIFEDVVLPCLRGEHPRFPVSAAMGEGVWTGIENGRTVIRDREKLPRRHEADGGE